MDLTSVKMKQGEGQWQDKFNRLVDAVQKVGGVTDQLQWTKFSKDGIVTGDLLQLLPSSGYSYLQVGSCKIIRLHLDLKASKDYTGSYIGHEVTLPDVIAAGQPMLGRAGDTFNWAYIGGNKIAFTSVNGASQKITAGNLLFVDKVYIK